MTAQQPERLSPEREQEIRRIFAVGHHPIGSEVLAELDAVRDECNEAEKMEVHFEQQLGQMATAYRERGKELDAVREELDEANDVYNIVQDIGEALGVPHGSVIAIHAPLLAKQLRADLTSANERVRVLEHALREAVGALSALGIALPDEKMLLAQ